MRRIVMLMHVSLDGFVAGPAGEMDWIKLGDEMWEYVEGLTNAADTALYGAVTYRMMESYWPTAGQKSGASKHDIEHSRWANNAHKIVFSKTITETHWDNTRIIASNAKAEMARLKSQAGKNLLILGSPGLVESFMREDLIDEFHLTVNPVVLGNGKRLFAQNANTVDLQLLGAKRLTSGVVALSYEKS